MARPAPLIREHPRLLARLVLGGLGTLLLVAFAAGQLAAVGGGVPVVAGPSVATTQADTTITHTDATGPVQTESTSTPTEIDMTMATLVAVTDGDTANLRLATGEVWTVRLIGVNAPETGECYAEEAAAALSELLVGRQISIQSDVNDRDQYDRLLRYLYVDDIFVNAAIVARGYAFSHHYPPDTAQQRLIDQAQQSAQQTRKGIWAPDACGTSFLGSLAIAGIAYNPPGDDSLRLNDEWVAIRNTGVDAIDLGSWQIRDESATHRYTFSAGFLLAPGGVVVLHTGCGTNSANHVYWCKSDTAVWNNSGDTVFVLDPHENLHLYMGYDATRPSDTVEGLDIPSPGLVTTATTVTTIGPPGSATTAYGGTSPVGGGCHSSYPTLCIPPPPPDLDCGDIPYRDFTVIGSDPHNFDGNDNDGIGCES